MIKKIFLLLFTYIVLTTSVYSAGSSGGDGNKVKKLTSYDTAEKRINKAKKA